LTGIRSISANLAVMLLFGCGTPSRTPIVVYSPHGKELLGAFEERYEALHPDQDVQWLDMGSQDAYDRVRTERGNPQADVWWGGPMLMFDRAAMEGLLEPYRPTWDTTVPPEEKSEGAFWYGTALLPEVIMYNTRTVDSSHAPQDWDALLDPVWKDRIIIRLPLASGTMRMLFASIIERERRRTGNVEAGLRWLRALDANTKSYAADPTQLYLKIAREEGAVTIWDLPDVVIQSKEHGYPFGYVIPAGGTPVITDGIALVKGARHLEAAKGFYEFVTSRESMIFQAERFSRVPARRDIPPSDLPGWIAHLRLASMNIDWRAVSPHEQEWMHLWDEQVKGRGRTTQ
jgi:iron(III) transport system substrate-binding protein